MNMGGNVQNNVFAILGAGRSGSSLIARGLNALGVGFGNKLKPSNKLWNPKGFWEDVEIAKINRRAQDILYVNWMTLDPFLFNNPRHQALIRIKRSAIRLLKSRFATTQFWGFKDPSTARLLPLWQEVFEDFNLAENYIITLRNPLDSAHSSRRVVGNDIEMGLLIWLFHVMQAIDGTEGKQRVIVSYENTLEDPRRQLERIRSALHLQIPPNTSDIDYYVNSFLDRKLQHYKAHCLDINSHSAIAVAPVCTKMYELLSKVANDNINIESSAFKKTWHECKSEFETLAPIYRYMGIILKRNKELERRIRRIGRSITWRLTYPLQMLEYVLRKSWKKSRNERLLKSFGY